MEYCPIIGSNCLHMVFLRTDLALMYMQMQLLFLSWIIASIKYKGYTSLTYNTFSFRRAVNSGQLQNYHQLV